jgi:hypothetical protein
MRLPSIPQRHFLRCLKILGAVCRSRYRCPFEPPGPALAAGARGGPLIFVPPRPGTIIYRARVVLAHGLGGSPRPGSSCRFEPGQPANARPYTRLRAIRSQSHLAMAAGQPQGLKWPWGWKGVAGWRPPPRARRAGRRPPPRADVGRAASVVRKVRRPPAVGLYRAQAQGTPPPPRVGHGLLA